MASARHYERRNHGWHRGWDRYDYRRDLSLRATREAIGSLLEHLATYDRLRLTLEQLGGTVADLQRITSHLQLPVPICGGFADGVAHLPMAEGYAGHSETLRRLTACGDVVAQEVICPTEQARSVNERNTELIRQRAIVVRASHPAFEQLIDEYVARQERETQILGTDVLCAIWVLRRA